MISSDQETTSDPGVASWVQELGPATIQHMHELTPAPPSPSKMSLDPCLGEHASLRLGEASEATSRAADEGLTTIQGDRHETDKGPKQHDTSVGGGPNADEVPEQHEAVTSKVVEVIDSSGTSFELAPLEVAIDMAIVPSTMTPPAEVTLVTAASMMTPEVTPVTVASTVTPSAEVALVPISFLTVL
ncbi:hypothetical protein AMTR_s00132p00104650 [Amborella trichopoda]|uniref:Uncharacterized protein n=1 Tax=Amborella trichopoda TaxID=13333 RepID=W1NDN7_AMBTC|nr:hypothetical protein AMTR_s00132p00104650 [Amborella trichopoda]